MMEATTKHKRLFDRNINRVNSLCNLYNTLRTDNIKESKDYKFTDILRSAVVMLHSSFEEYFRGVLREKLPKICNSSDLKNFSFAGSNGKHKDKITLGQLLEYRGQSVDELICNSISEELSLTSFNNFSDICNWAQKARINISSFHEEKRMEQLIQRRHKIVHEADNKNNDVEYSIVNLEKGYKKINVFDFLLDDNVLENV